MWAWTKVRLLVGHGPRPRMHGSTAGATEAISCRGSNAQPEVTAIAPTEHLVTANDARLRVVIRFSHLRALPRSQRPFAFQRAFGAEELQ